MNIFNSLLPQLVKYDVHTTRKINSIHAIFYHILSLSFYTATIAYERATAVLSVCLSVSPLLSQLLSVSQ